MAAIPSSGDRQHYALQTIFSFFLGLMVLALIGVGVNTFLPSPTDQHQAEQQSIQQQTEAISLSANGKSLDTTQQAEMNRLNAEQSALQRTIDVEMKGWARTTSIILVIFATIVMSVSLVRSEQLRVISNGLLLGGLFTMIYGVGWVIFSGNSTARFVVITFALAVAIALGYVKFVRQRRSGPEPEPDTAGRSGGNDVALAGLAARVAALEARAAAAAEALGGAPNEEDRS